MVSGTKRNGEGTLIGMQDPIVKSETMPPSGGYAAPTGLCRAFRCDVGGDVNFEFYDGTTDILAVDPKVWEPMEFKRIVLAGTTATGLHAGY